MRGRLDPSLVAVARVLGTKLSPGAYRYQGTIYFDFEEMCRASDLEPTPDNQAALEQRIRATIKQLAGGPIVSATINKGRN